MLKRQRVQKVIDDLSLALDFAKAMLKDGHTNAALLRLHGAMDRGVGDIVRALKDPDDYPPQHRAQFDAIVAELARLAPDHSLCIEEAKITATTKFRTAATKNGFATSVYIVTLTEDGLDSEEYCPEHGPISHCGGRIPADQTAEETARYLLKAAGVQVPR